MQKSLYIKDEEIQNYYKAIKDGVYLELDKVILNMIKKFLEGCAEVELDEIINASRYERNDLRQDYRNGYRKRWITTHYGETTIKLPRTRYNGSNFSFIERYKRRSKRIDLTIREMFFNGISTRKIAKTIKKLFPCNYYISAGSVSNIVKGINDEINQWLKRELKDKYEIMLLDGVYLNVRSPIKSQKRCVLVAYGIDSNGIGEIIGFKLASHGESENAWANFINELYHRGIEGNNIKLCVIDGNKGLKKAIELIWPKAKIQRCWVHKMRNVINYFPHRYREEAYKDLSKMYNAQTKKESIELFKCFKGSWEGLCPKGVRCLENDLEELLVCYEVVKEIKDEKERARKLKIIKTTNRIERIFKEVRRRTRSIGLFTNRDSLIRIMYKVFSEHNEKQEERRKKIKKTSSSLNQIYTQILT